MGDFNIDITKEYCSGFDKLEELYDTFNRTKLILKHAIKIITNRQLNYFSPTNFSRDLHNSNWIKQLSQVDINFYEFFCFPSQTKNYVFSKLKKVSRDKVLS